MVCNDVKYCPEKDADSYYGRIKGALFNPVTSPPPNPRSGSIPARKTLTRRFHCQSVTDARIPRKETARGARTSIFRALSRPFIAPRTPEISNGSFLAPSDSDSQILSGSRLPFVFDGYSDGKYSENSVSLGKWKVWCRARFLGAPRDVRRPLG